LWRKGPTNLEAIDSLYVFNTMLKSTEFTKSIIAPSSWVVRTIFFFRDESFSEAFLYLVFLYLSGFLLLRLLAYFSRRFYFRGFSRLKSFSLPAGTKKKFLSHLLKARSPLTNLFAKDIIATLRDPAQWLQSVIFFGAIFLYIVNLRNLPYAMESPFWKNLVIFLNLGAISLTVAMLNVRFIFPLFSLEGSKYWAWGLSHLGKEDILKEKFFFSFIPSFGVTLVLIIASNVVLESNLFYTIVNCGIAFFLCLGLSSMAVGLGIMYPSFSQNDVQIISNSLGGVLLLVINIIYIGVNLIIMGTPFHWYFTRRIGGGDFYFIFVLIALIIIIGNIFISRIFLKGAQERLKVMEF